MRKILVATLLLTISMCQIFGQDVVRKEKISEVKRVGDKVWFIKEVVSDSLICLSGSKSKCLVGTNTIHTADVFMITGENVKRLSVDELKILYQQGSLDKEMESYGLLIKRATTQSWFLFDKFKWFFKTAQIDKASGIISEKQFTETRSYKNILVVGLVLVLIALFINLITRVAYDDVDDKTGRNLFFSVVGFIPNTPSACCGSSVHIP